MPRTRRFPKPKQRSTFSVSSLISNRKRIVSFVTSSKGSTTRHTEPDVLIPSSSLHEVHEPTLRDDKTPQTWNNRKEKTVEEWINLSDKLQQSWLHQEGAIDGAFCVQCVQPIATIRCKDCGPDQFYCENCAVDFHSKRCCFHLLEKWEVI
jgi:hypothetical protein